MFTFLRYGLIPLVLFCVVIVAASVDAYSTNITQKSTWPETVATVLESQDFGQDLAESRGTQNTFPDPHGTVTYVIDGKTYTWQGRGRDIGVTVMNPGDAIKVHYNPENPSEINTLVLLGAATGTIIFATAFAFLVFYVWFFWLRGFFGRSAPPDDLDGDLAESFAGRVSTQFSEQSERSRLARGGERAAVIDNKAAGQSFNSGPRTTFGKR